LGAHALLKPLTGLGALMLRLEREEGLQTNTDLLARDERQWQSLFKTDAP
jgi:hypothetical protein